MSESLLLWGLVFGSVGLALFVYGRKQSRPVPLVCGLALMVVPYFVDNTWALVGIGGALMALPWFLRRY